MATLLTSLSAIDGVAANTASQPLLGRLDAILKHSKRDNYCVPNEHICAELARFLGLPVPPSGLVYKSGNDPEHFFASLNFNLCGGQLPPINPTICVKEQEFLCVGVILFDIFIANGDRHAANLSLDTSVSPARLAIFDHSHALFGARNGQGCARFVKLKDELGMANHCLLKAIPSDSHFGLWIDRIARLPDYLIDEVCDATVPLKMITLSEAAGAKEFLKQRRHKIKTLVEQNKKEFIAVSQWSFLR
jgi:hypothetical protein